MTDVTQARDRLIEIRAAVNDLADAWVGVRVGLFDAIAGHCDTDVTSKHWLMSSV